MIVLKPKKPPQRRSRSVERKITQSTRPIKPKFEIPQQNIKNKEANIKQSSLDIINEEKKEFNYPDFSKLYELEKKKKLKFIVCSNTLNELNQEIKYNWFDSTHQAKDVYDFFFPEKNYQIFWIEDNKIKYLKHDEKISQMRDDRVLIFPINPPK